MEIWSVELTAVILVGICMIQGACQGLLLKVYSLVRAVLFVAGGCVAAFVLMIVLPKGIAGREAIALIAGLILTGTVLGVIGHILKIADHIPVINTLNKLGGAVLGALLGLVLLWVLMFVVVAGRNLEWCREVDDAVKQSALLGELYRINPLLVIMQKL